MNPEQSKLFGPCAPHTYGFPNFVLAYDTNELLYNLFWRQLEPEERKILLRFCHFEWIGLKYIDELLPEEKPDTGEIQALLARVPLLEFHES